MLSPEEAKKIREAFGEKLHPHLLKGESPGEPVVLSDSSIEQIVELVDEHIGQDSLLAVVEATLAVSDFLEVKHEAPKTARRLADIVNRPKILEAMQAVIDRQQAQAADGAAKNADDFSKFADEPSEKVAPDVDAEKPEGAIGLNDIDFPKRM